MEHLKWRNLSEILLNLYRPSKVLNDSARTILAPQCLRLPMHNMSRVPVVRDNAGATRGVILHSSTGKPVTIYTAIGYNFTGIRSLAPA